MKWWVVVAGLSVACPAEKLPASTGLRVPLEGGWVATPVTRGLAIGPPGTRVATLELRPVDVPRAAELGRVATDQGATELLLDEGEGFSAARYSLGEGRGGFLAVKRVDTRAVWCASTAEATLEQLADALAVCRAVTLEPTR